MLFHLFIALEWKSSRMCWVFLPLLSHIPVPDMSWCEECYEGFHPSTPWMRCYLDLFHVGNTVGSSSKSSNRILLNHQLDGCWTVEGMPNKLHMMGIPRVDLFKSLIIMNCFQDFYIWWSQTAILNNPKRSAWFNSQKFCGIFSFNKRIFSQLIFSHLAAMIQANHWNWSNSFKVCLRDWINLSQTMYVLVTVPVACAW